MKNIVLLILCFNIFSQIFAQSDVIVEQQEIHALINNFSEKGVKDTDLKCGFSNQLAAREVYNSLSPDLQKKLEVQVLDQLEREVTIQSPSGKFNLHYDINGPNSVPQDDLLNNGIPDYIDSAAVALDYCWQILIDELGYTPPLNETGQPVTAYDIYFTDFLNSFLYGQTVPSFSEQSGNWVSYIELNNDFSEAGLFTRGLSGLKVTVAHEFFHALQITYNVWNSELYFYEMSSSWIEEIIYPEINDYFQYLPDLFDSVQDRLLFSRSNEYANALYLHMLSQKHGINLISEIWQQTRTNSPLLALYKSLADYQSSTSISINDYGKWLYFTGERTLSGQFFADADSFPMISIGENFIFDGSQAHDTSFVVQASSFKLLKADQPAELLNTAKVESNTDNRNVGLNIIGEDFFERKPSAAGTFTTFNLDIINQDLVFVVSNAANASDIVNFIFFPDSGIYKNNVTMGPNPVILNEGAAANFYSVPLGAKVFILNVNLKLIREMANDNNLDQLVWDMKDAHGKNVSSGIYYYIVKQNGKSQKTGKIAVVR